MKQIMLSLPGLKEVMGVHVVDWPLGFKWPYTVIVREAWTRYRKDAEAGAMFTVPGYGVLTMTGRDYVFEPEKGYAAEKGYEKRLEGRW